MASIQWANRPNKNLNRAKQHTDMWDEFIGFTFGSTSKF